MRLGYVLLVVAAALLVSCDGASATKPQLPARNRIQSVATDDGPSSRLLRGGDGLKKIPASVVKELMGDSTKRTQFFQTWSTGNVSVKRLAKSLDLNTMQLKQLRKFMNRKKIDKATLLKQYDEYLAKLKKTA